MYDDTIQSLGQVMAVPKVKSINMETQSTFRFFVVIVCHIIGLYTFEDAG